MLEKRCTLRPQPPPPPPLLLQLCIANLLIKINNN